MRSTRSGMVWKMLSLVTALAILAGCSGSAKKSEPAQQTKAPAAQAPKKMEVSIAMWSPPNNFSPINTDSSYGFFAVEMMFDTLVKINDKIEFVPKLAEKWDVSRDFTTFTFHINPKAKWHDGTPVTAKDVVFTMNTIANKETVTNRSATINLIKGTDPNGKSDGPLEGVKAVDEKTVQFVAKKAVDPLSFLEKVGANIYIIPEHILGKVAPKDLDKHPFFQEPKVGSGPFKFVKYASGQYIEYARNEEYYLGKPKLEKVFVRIMQPTTAVAALEKGEIDMTAGSGIGEVPIQDWDKVQALPGINAVTFVSKTSQYMDINHTKPYLQSEKVRQALAYGINRKLIVDNLLKGTGVVLDGPYTPIYKYLNSDIKIRGFDPAKAKQLFTEAGWDFNRELDLLVPLGNKVREQSADIIMANLQQAGVKVKVQKMDFPTLQSRRGKADYDLALIGWSDTLDPDVSSQFRTGGVYNQGAYSRPHADELLDKGATTADFKERKAIYDELQQIWFNDPPVIWLYSPNSLVAASKRIENVKMSAMGLLWNIHEWDVKN